MSIPLPTLNVLDAITIPTHCPAPWHEMEGSDKKRFCTACGQNVHDIAELTTQGAVQLLTRSERSPCVRIYRRSDGRIVTADGVTRRERAWRWLRRRSMRAASLFSLWFLSGCRIAHQGVIGPREYHEAVKVPAPGQTSGATASTGPSLPPPDFTHLPPAPIE